MCDRICTLKEVLKITGKSRSWIYIQMKKGNFPKSISMGSRSVGWIYSELSAWIDYRIMCRDQNDEGIN